MKAIKEKCVKSGLYKKRITKDIFVILKNIEIICFIDINNVNKYPKCILNNLNGNKYKTLKNYLKNYWFKKDLHEYNFSEFIKKYKTNKKIFEKLYLTNNIVESLHGKINYYLPKHTTNRINFINTLKNIFINDTCNNNTIIRHDYKTKAMILLIEKENINNEFKWISFDIFKKYLNSILNNKNINNLNEEYKKLFDSNVYSFSNSDNEDKGNNNIINEQAEENFDNKEDSDYKSEDLNESIEIHDD